MFFKRITVKIATRTWYGYRPTPAGETTPDNGLPHDEEGTLVSSPGYYQSSVTSYTVSDGRTTHVENPPPPAYTPVNEHQNAVVSAQPGHPSWPLQELVAVEDYEYDHTTTTFGLGSARIVGDSTSQAATTVFPSRKVAKMYLNERACKFIWLFVGCLLLFILGALIAVLVAVHNATQEPKDAGK